MNVNSSQAYSLCNFAVSSSSAVIQLLQLFFSFFFLSSNIVVCYSTSRNFRLKTCFSLHTNYLNRFCDSVEITLLSVKVWISILSTEKHTKMSELAHLISIQITIFHLNHGAQLFVSNFTCIIHIYVKYFGPFKQRQVYII